MSKPREFWIIENPLTGAFIVNTESYPGKYAHQHIHVIEKKAYDELQQKLAEAGKERDEWKAQALAFREALDMIQESNLFLDTKENRTRIADLCDRALAKFEEFQRGKG